MYQKEFPGTEFGFGIFTPAHWVFQDNATRSDSKRVEGNTFHWKGSYLIAEGELPFGSKLASARVYVYDVIADKEVFSYDFDHGDGELDCSIHLTPGKTRLRLYGEVIGQEGMQYRYFLGEVLQPYEQDYFYFRYPSNGIPEPMNYSEVGESYSLHATFLNQTTVGLKTYS